MMLIVPSNAERAVTGFILAGECEHRKHKLRFELYAHEGRSFIDGKQVRIGESGMTLATARKLLSLAKSVARIATSMRDLAQ